MEKQDLLKLLHDNDTAVLRAVHVMCEIDKANSGNARDGVGLSLYDKQMFYDVDEMLLKRTMPTNSILQHCRQRSYSYWSQLLKKAAEKESREYLDEVKQFNLSGVSVSHYYGECETKCTYGNCEDCVGTICAEVEEQMDD